MSYDEKTLKAECDRCKHQWQVRSQSISQRCPKCSSYNWNTGSRKYEVLIARACGVEPGTDMQKFCILEYIDNPHVVTDDVFFITKDDIDTYLRNKRFPTGSGLVFLGNFEKGDGNILVINECKLIYCHEALLNNYSSTPYCHFNVRSFYERKKQLAKYEEQLRQKEIAEAEARDLKITTARNKLENEAKLKGQVLEAEVVVQDGAATTEDKLKAIAFLEKVKR